MYWILLIFNFAIFFLGIDCANIIYYVPERSDDYLAFSLSIADSLDKGQTVKVVLFNGWGPGTNPFSSDKPCPLHNFPESLWDDSASYAAHQDSLDENGYHVGINLDDEALIDIRNEEFLDAMSALGLKECESMNSRQSCYQIPVVKVDMLHRHSSLSAYIDDPLTQAYYNYIYTSELNFPGTFHKFVGSPRDCTGLDGKGSPDVHHLATWYAARQLVLDYPNGIGYGWNFVFYLEDFPLTVSNSSAELDQKLNKYISNPPSKQNMDPYKGIKAEVGKAYKQWNPAADKYAIGLHMKPYQFSAARQDNNIYLERIEYFTPQELSTRWCNEDEPVVPLITARTSTPTSPAQVDISLIVGFSIFILILLVVAIIGLSRSEFIKNSCQRISVDRTVFV